MVKGDRPILEVENLQADFPAPKGNVKAVNNVSFSIKPGEIVALVGESGSGKSVTALSIMRLNASTVRYGRHFLLIADEPTTALDVTIQAQILNLMKALQKQTNTAILLITHDLGVVAEMADRVMVMYCGEIVEEGDVYSIFERALHPYTKGLLSSVPKLAGRSAKRLEAIPGTVPHPLELPLGCHYSTRCAHATGECAAHKPRLMTYQEGRQVACWHPLEEASEVTQYG